MVYVTAKDGRTHKIDFFCVAWEGEKTTYYVDNVLRQSKVYYRPEKTLDDHMGNTPCGLYTIVPLRYFDGEQMRTQRKRVYIFWKGRQ